jgi:hypothetical protein
VGFTIERALGLGSGFQVEDNLLGIYLLEGIYKILDS